MGTSTVGECVREALIWGKKNKKPPEEVINKVNELFEDNGISGVSNEYLLGEIEFHAPEVGYEREKYE